MATSTSSSPPPPPRSTTSSSSSVSAEKKKTTYSEVAAATSPVSSSSSPPQQCKPAPAPAAAAKKAATMSPTLSSIKNHPMAKELLKHFNTGLTTSKAIDSHSILLGGNLSFVLLSFVVYYLVGSGVAYRIGVLLLLTANATLLIQQLRTTSSGSTAAATSASQISNLLFKDSNSPYLLLSFLMAFLSPLPLLPLLSLVCLSLLRMVESAQKAQPSPPFPAWKDSKVWKTYGPLIIQKILPHKNNILEVQCQLELLAIPQSFINIVTSSTTLSTILLPVILLSLLRWNYIISPRHRLSIRTLDSQIMRLLAHPSCPPTVLPYYSKLKKVISSTTPLSAATASATGKMKR